MLTIRKYGLATFKITLVSVAVYATLILGISSWSLARKLGVVRAQNNLAQPLPVPLKAGQLVVITCLGGSLRIEPASSRQVLLTCGNPKSQGEANDGNSNKN